MQFYAPIAVIHLGCDFRISEPTLDLDGSTASRGLAGMRPTGPSPSPPVVCTALGKWGSGRAHAHTHSIPQHSERLCKLDCRALLESSRRRLWRPLEWLRNYALEAELGAGLA